MDMPELLIYSVLMSFARPVVVNPTFPSVPLGLAFKATTLLSSVYLLISPCLKYDLSFNHIKEHSGPTFATPNPPRTNSNAPSSRKPFLTFLARSDPSLL